MEWFEALETSLDSIVHIAQFALESLSVFCVLVGLVKTIQLAIVLKRRHQHGFFPFNRIRMRFGMWLALALEFQLGADILATTVSPSLNELGRLAAIAVIRTFLNYFLEKEMESQLALEREMLGRYSGASSGAKREGASSSAKREKEQGKGQGEREKRES